MKWNRSLTFPGRVAILIVGVGVLGWVWRRSAESWRETTTSAWIAKAQSQDSDERRYAISKLASAGALDSHAVVPAIAGALKDRVASVRNEAALALWRYLAESLKKRGNGMADQARGAASSLIEVVEHDRDAAVRASAAFAAASLIHGLKEAGFDWANSHGGDPLDPKTLVKALCAVLERDPKARLSLLILCRRLGPIDAPAPAALLAALDDPSRIVRIEALQAVAEFSSGVDKAVSVLLSDAETAPGESQFNQWRYVYPLRQAAERLHPSSAVVPRLIDGLQSQNPDVRQMAVVLLRHLGPAGRPATQALMSATRAMIRSAKRTPEPGEVPFFSEFASTLIQIASVEDAISVLSAGLDRDHPASGAHAAWFLGKLGHDGGAAVPILVKALKDIGDPPAGRALEEYAHAILRSLWDIAPEAELPNPTADQVVEVLSRALDYPQNFIRQTAAAALGDFGRRAACTLPQLRALSDNDQAPKEVREAAARSVQQIELDTKPASELTRVSPRVAEDYAGVGAKTLSRDIDALLKAKLLIRDEKGYASNRDLILTFLPPCLLMGSSESRNSRKPAS